MTRALSVLLPLLLVAGVARAQEDLPPPPIIAVPDSVLGIAKGHVVAFALRDGHEVVGTAVAFDGQSITLVEEKTHRIFALSRLDVISVRLPDLVTVRPPAPPSKVRHVGLQVSQGVGNLLVDFDYGRFYGYLGTSIGYPVIFTNDTPQYVAGVIGMGGQWRLGTSNWKFDLTGTLTPTYWGGFSMGIGVSAGFHYTSPSGFTAGFKIPVFGIAPGCNYIFGTTTQDEFGNGDAHCSNHVRSGSDYIGNYYLQAAMSSPILSVGYRF